MIEINKKMEQAFNFVKEGDAEEAILIFSQLQSLYPDIIEIYPILCELYIKSGRTDIPADWIVKAVSHEPGCIAGFKEVSARLYAAGEYQKCADTLSVLIETDPDDYDAWESLSVVYSTAGETEWAARCVEKAHEISDRILVKKKVIPESMVRGDYLPLSLSLEAYNRCNVSCIMCDAAHRSENAEKKPDLMMLTADDLHNKLDGVRHIQTAVLSGTYCEPFLNKELPEIISVLKRKKASVEVITNGTLINRHIREKIINNGLDRLSISLHGATADTAEGIMRRANFHRIISNIRDISKLKKERSCRTPQISIIFIGMKRNIRELADLVSLAAELSVECVNVKSLMERQNEGLSLLAGESLISEPGLLRVEYERAQRTAKKNNVKLIANDPYRALIENDHAINETFGRYSEHTSLAMGMTRYCLFPFSKPFLSLSGNVSLCCAEKGRNVRMGNIKKSGLAALWNNSNYINHRSALLTGENLPPHCYECERAPAVDPGIMQMDIALRQARQGVDEGRDFIIKNKWQYAEYVKGMRGIGAYAVKCDL